MTTNLNQIKLTDIQVEKIVSIAKEAYSLPQNYNTDIYLIDGEIVSLNTFGNTYPQSYEACLLAINSNYTYDYQSMVQEGMTDEQREFCEEKNWLAIDCTNSNNPNDWVEFSVDDDLEFETTVIETIERNLNKTF